LPSLAVDPGWSLERPLWTAGFSPVAGIDEAGRGALAGPVVAAAVILPYGTYPFRDSKVLSAGRRERLADHVREVAIAWALGSASAAEVDRINVLRATHLAAARALAELSVLPSALVTDYLALAWSGAVRSEAKADARSFQVAAASILAKTERDARMRAWAGRYPAYGFSSNKGYGSPQHLDAIARFGPCPLHRRSFRPVAQHQQIPGRA
jgi:ribonuclease HII